MLHPSLQKLLHYKAALFAAVITLFGVTNFLSISEKKNWPQHEVTIASSSFVPDPADSQKAVLDFTYRYQMGALKISSTKVYASTFRGDPKYTNEVEEVVSRFPIGSKALAYVNPSDPYESYLDLAPGTVDYALPGAGAACLVIFFTHAFLTRRKLNEIKSIHRPT